MRKERKDSGASDALFFIIRANSALREHAAIYKGREQRYVNLKWFRENRERERESERGQREKKRGEKERPVVTSTTSSRGGDPNIVPFLVKA